MSRNKRKPKWVLLYRVVGGRDLYVYEPLRKYEIQSKLRKGWELIR